MESSQLTTPLFLIIGILFLVMILFPGMLSAQVPPPPPDAPNQTPIDGGLGILLAAGGAYAVNKLRRKE